ncbi:choice-of-anchor L domain-containing protein [Flavobacterium sp. RHBU_24]|uniref:choice-of-anchor L domain-containing protein n=1 Tax=Flavobacterium sp. RHBU_24 TaxID=3391185 RepID=UPI00398537CB
MRKNLLVLLGLLLSAAGFSQGVVVSTTANGNANPTQLVNSLVKYDDLCLTQVSNATKSTGLNTVNYAQGNSIGSYTNTNPAFPFASGVVLVSGAAATASGPNTSVSTDSGAAAQTWLGDADLNAALAGLPGGFQSMNATVLEFDFVAATSTLDIPYIFASEEYGQYQCNSKDGMAILIKTGAQPYQNIARIPGTNDVVSVATLRNSAYNGNCASQNLEYFDLFNGGGAASTAAINFEGQSKVLHAVYTLVPGTTYHLKIVVADDGWANANPTGTDPQYNSAVFFEYDSFNLGHAVVGENLTAAANTALCQGETLNLNTGLSAANYSVTWTRNSQPHPGGISTSITQSGTYVATITNTVQNCTSTQAVEIEFTPQIIPGPASTLYACPDGTGTYTYNLAANTPSLKQGLNPATIVTYHASQADADANTGILNASSYTTNGGTVTIYARVKSYNSSCYTVVTFSLATIPNTTATAPATINVCEGTIGSNTASVNLTAQTATLLGTQSPADYAVTYYTSSAGADTATDNITTASNYTVTGPSQVIWARVQSLQSSSCFAVTSFTINVNPIPPVSTLNNTTACGSYTLPTIANGSYYASSGGNNPIDASVPLTTSQTVYIYASNSAGCSNQTSFTVTVLQGSAVDVPDNVIACNSYTLPPLEPGQEYHGAPGGGAPMYPAGTVISSTQDVYFYIPSAAQCTQDTYFSVTIIAPYTIADQFPCVSYTLPALPAGYSYHSAPNGAGAPLTGNINTSQTIYIYGEAPDASCFVETSFDVTISPVVSPRIDVSACGTFTLPAVPVGNYYTGANGTGDLITAGTAITAPSGWPADDPYTQTIYIYYQNPDNANCTSQDSFVVTINPLPAIGAFPSTITACGQYILPPAAAGDPQIAGYYTGANGTGTFYPVGSTITSSIILRPTTSPNEYGCRRFRTIAITIIGDTAPTPGDISECGSYMLPPLPAGGKYYPSPGCTGTEIPAGTVITTTQTIYVCVSNGSCTAEGSFTVTITPLPALPNFSNVVACTSYTLPALANGNYYTATDGGGTMLNAGAQITESQTIYVYAVSSTDPECTNQKQFRVSIVTPALTPADVITCGTYTVPQPAAAWISYYTGPNQTGTLLTPNSVLTANTTIYLYANVNNGTNCTADPNPGAGFPFSYTVTITNAPSVDDPADVEACNSYVLPTLTSGEYWTLSGGAAGGGTMIPAGTELFASQTLYVYNSNPGCEAENEFEVTINNISVASIQDQTVCADPGYLLEPLNNGNYYTMSGGPSTPGNQLLNAGEFITSATATENAPETITVYVYDAIAGTNPLCFAESSFDVTVYGNPVIEEDRVVAECGCYTLPVLGNADSNYYSLPGGSGTMYTAGQQICTQTTLYIFTQSDQAPFCISESQLDILVNPTPPADVTECDSYILPPLVAGGQYWTAPNGSGGSGTQIPPGTEITTTQTIYYFVPSAAACTDDTSFNVTINITPVVAPVADITECDSYVLPALAVGNYYTAAGGPTGGGQVIPAGTIIEPPFNWDPAVYYTQQIYVYAETATVPNCSDEASFEVRIIKTPTVDARSIVDVCDSYTFGPLSQYNTYYMMSGGPNVPGQSQPPATLITNADPDLGTRIYIYAESPLNPGCSAETYFDVMIFSAAVDSEINAIETAANASGNYYADAYDDEIVPNHPLGVQRVVDIEACDTFTLPDLNVGGTGPDDSYIQQYYTLPDGPENPDPAQQEVNNLTITASTTVYLYRKLIGRVECTDQSRLNIVINTTPVVTYTPADFSECDEFTLPPLTVGNYFNSSGGVDPITDLTIVSSQPVYVYAQTGTNYICSDEHMFNLTINHIDVTDPVDPMACDSYTLPAPPSVVSTTASVARYFELAGGPNVAGQVEHFAGDVYLPGTYTLWAWAETGTTPNCTDEKDFTITVVPRPTAIIPTGLVTCAINDAGTPAQLQGIFDLTGAIAEAIGAQTNVAGIVFETEADANFASSNNAIPNPADYHNNGGASQTLWIRLYSTLVNGCYTVVPLQLTVNPRPIAVDPVDPYEICDNGDSDVDGIGVFDLTTYEDTVLGTLDPTLHTVTYYESIAAITSGAPAITSPTNYISPSTTVFIKVTINATGCYDIVPLELIVNPLPIVVNPTPYSICDNDDTPGDVPGQEVFDLTSKIDEIMASAPNGAQGVTATFYHTLNDAIAMTAGITNPTTYTNPLGTPVEAIYVRITDNVTGCYRIVLLDIRVEPLPLLAYPTADTLITCSTNSNGYGFFDLNGIADEMINGAPDTTVEFYQTMLNAQNDLNPIQVWNPYTTNNALTDFLYIVATNNLTGCRSVVTTLTLTVNPAPVDVDLEDITQCDDQDGQGQDDLMVFDLTQQDAEIISQIPGAVAGDYIIHYFTDENYAIDGLPRITNPATFIGTDEQPIWVRIENLATECFIVVSFKLHINKPEPIAHPTNLVVCEDALPNDGQTLVDLTVKDDEILTPSGIGEGNIVQYFEDEDDRDNNVNPIADFTAWTNTTNPQTIFVLVTTPQGCISKETLTIIVKPLPNPNTTPDTLVLCDDTLPLNDGQEPFNLNLANANILLGDSLSSLAYFTTMQDAEDNVNAIPNPAAYINAVPWDDVVYARVTRTGSQAGDPGCYIIVTLPLHVDPLPPIYDSTGVVPRYAICNDPTTGFEEFNLIGHVSDILVAAGEDPLNYDIKFYKGLAEIAAGTPLPLVYTNETPSQQTIYVVAINNTTTCEIQTTLTLYAEQAAVANPITTVGNNPIVECDEDGTNDGFTPFDLTPAGTEALGTQNPTQFSVEYYLTEAAANLGDTTSAEYIATPATFTNTVYLTQTIWVRITNTATFAPCYAVTSFDIRVSLLPEPSISSEDNDDTICVDYLTGDVEKPVYLHADNTDPALDTYRWQLNGVDIPGATAQDYTAVEEGLYTVFATNADGCESDPISAFEVFLSGPASPLPNTAGYVIGNAFGDNQTITVLAQGFGEYQYSIAPEDPDGTSIPTGPWQNSNVFTNVPQGYFTIYVRDVNTMELNPCSMLELHGVSVIDYPKFFTPNGDGINDYWNIVGMITHPEARIYIFDRYGKLIKQLSPLSRTDMDEGWDGTFNGNPVPADDYWFRVEFLENGSERTFKAHFTLKR